MLKKKKKTNTNAKRTGIWLSAALIVLIMLISIGFRLLSAHAAKEILPEGYYDPETGLSFLTEMDSYYHLRMTRDIMEYGHPGEAVVNGENWDTLSYAPNGRSASEYSPLMAYLAAAVTRVADAAFGIPLEKVIYYLGMFLSALVVIPVFILTKELTDGGTLCGGSASEEARTSDSSKASGASKASASVKDHGVTKYSGAGIVAASVAAVLSAINYGYFVHTAPGFYDTDMVIPFAGAFFLCFSTLLVKTLFGDGENGQDSGASLLRKRIIYGTLTFISLFLLILSWNVYGLFVGIFALALILFGALMIIPEIRKKNKPGRAGSKNVSGQEKASDTSGKRKASATSGSQKASAASGQRKTSDTSGKNTAGAPDTKRMILLILALLAAFLICILIADRSFFKTILSQAQAVFAGGAKSLFPDAYVSVSEMRKPSLTAGGLTGLFQMKVLSESDIGVINAVGGIVPTLSALCMCVLMVLRIRKGERRFPDILMIVWYLITLVLAVRGWRFIMLFAVPVAILCGKAVGEVFHLMRTKKMMDYPVYVVMILLLALFPALYGAYRSTGDSLPVVNRTVYNAAAAIRENTSEDTIIASWWDFGYFYEEKAERRTIFDGGSQNGQRVYFIAKALATDDEILSRNLIRMLSGSGDEAADGMIDTFGEKRETLALMDELLKTDKETAYQTLSDKGIGEEKAKELSGLLFPDANDPVVLLLTPDMPRISGWFATFGFYGENDSENAEEMSSRFQVFIDSEEYHPEDQGGGWMIRTDKGDCRFVIEEKEDGYTAYTALAGQESSSEEDALLSQPYPVERVIVKSEEGIRSFRSDVELESGETGCTVFLTTGENGSHVTLMTSELMNSMFGRMFYLNGEGLGAFRAAASRENGTFLYWVG